MLRIRQYQPSDKEAVWDLHNVALAQVGAHLGPGPWDDDFQNNEGVYLDNNGEFLVGEYLGQIVGMMDTIFMEKSLTQGAKISD